MTIRLLLLLLMLRAGFDPGRQCAAYGPRSAQSPAACWLLYAQAWKTAAQQPAATQGHFTRRTANDSYVVVASRPTNIYWCLCRGFMAGVMAVASPGHAAAPSAARPARVRAPSPVRSLSRPHAQARGSPRGRASATASPACCTPAHRHTHTISRRQNSLYRSMPNDTSCYTLTTGTTPHLQQAHH